MRLQMTDWQCGASHRMTHLVSRNVICAIWGCRAKLANSRSIIKCADWMQYTTCEIHFRTPQGTGNLGSFRRKLLRGNGCARGRKNTCGGEDSRREELARTAKVPLPSGI